MFAQLGNYTFEGLKSPGSLSDNRGVRYGRIALVNGKDALQFTGEELAEIRLSLLLSIDFCDPVEEIEALRKSMTSAEVLPFIMGDGTVVGKYVITTVDVTPQRYSPTGELEAASISVDLVESAGGDEPEPKGIAVIDNDSTTGSKAITQTPAAQPPATPVETPAGGITADVSAGRNAVAKMKEVGQKIKNGTTQMKRGIRDVRRLADEVKQAYSSVKTKVENTQKIIQRAKQLPTSLDEAIRYAENLSKLDDVADMSVVQLNIDGMAAAAEKVGISAAPVAAFSATKEGGN